jgi:hypothetical protein
MSNTKNLFTFTTDWHAKIPTILAEKNISVVGHTLIHLGDHPGSEKFELFKKAYYNVINIVKREGVEVDDKLQITANLLVALEKELEVWRQINCSHGNSIGVGNDEMLLSLIYNEDGGRYKHFGEYRKTLPLSIQEVFFSNSVETLQGMADFYENCGAGNKIIVEGNVDNGYFKSFDPAVGGGFNTASIFETAVNTYASELQCVETDEAIIGLVPFYGVMNTSDTNRQTFIADLRCRKQSSDKPLLLCMHGQPSNAAHAASGIALDGEHAKHVDSVESMVRDLAEYVDLLVYGHVRAKLAHGLYGLNVGGRVITTKYLHEGEVFTVDLDQLAQLRAKCIKHQVVL